MKNLNDHRLTLRFTAREIERLRRHAEGLGLGLAAFVRMAAAQCMDERERKESPCAPERSSTKKKRG